jgi:hypothetical protein
MHPVRHSSTPSKPTVAQVLADRREMRMREMMLLQQSAYAGGLDAPTRSAKRPSVVAMVE